MESATLSWGVLFFACHGALRDGCPLFPPEALEDLRRGENRDFAQCRICRNGLWRAASIASVGPVPANCTLLRALLSPHLSRSLRRCALVLVPLALYLRALCPGSIITRGWISGMGFCHVREQNHTSTAPPPAPNNAQHSFSLFPYVFSVSWLNTCMYIGATRDRPARLRRGRHAQGRKPAAGVGDRGEDGGRHRGDADGREDCQVCVRAAIVVHAPVEHVFHVSCFDAHG